jgi:hypothetical protein
MKIRPLYDRIVVNGSRSRKRFGAASSSPTPRKRSPRKAKSSLLGTASVSKTASWFRSMSKSAIAFCSGNTPAATSNWMAMST